MKLKFQFSLLALLLSVAAMAHPPHMQIGKGTGSIGNFAHIDWSAISYCLEVDMDGTSVGAQELDTSSNGGANKKTVLPEFTAMTAIGNTLYFVQGNDLCSVAPPYKTYTTITGGWNNVSAMTAIGNKLYIVKGDDLYSVGPPYRGFTRLNTVTKTWNNVTAMTAMGNTLYIVQGDNLYSVVSPYDSYTRLNKVAGTWNNVPAMTAIGNTLYIVQGNNLYSVVSPYDSYTRLNKTSGTWNNAPAMTAIGNTLYIVQGNDLYSVVSPYDSYTRLNKTAGTWNNVPVMAAIDNTLYIEQGDNLYSVGPPYDSRTLLNITEIQSLLPLGGVFTATIDGVVCTLTLTDNGVKGTGRTALGSLTGTCYNFVLDNGIIADPFIVTGTYVPWTTLNARYLIQISGEGSQFDPEGESPTAGGVRFSIATISGFAEINARDTPIPQFTSYITTTKDIRGLGENVTYSQSVVWLRK